MSVKAMYSYHDVRIYPPILITIFPVILPEGSENIKLLVNDSVYLSFLNYQSFKKKNLMK